MDAYKVRRAHGALYDIAPCFHALRGNACLVWLRVTILVATRSVRRAHGARYVVGRNI